MRPDSAAVERAFRNFLAARGLRLSELNLGSAIKVMLEFQRDVKFDWADPEDDTLEIWWSESREADSSSGGFLGMFKTVTAGKLTGYAVIVSRDLWPLGDNTDFVTLDVIFQYAVTNPKIVGFSVDNERIDSGDFESLDEFVNSVFELNAFNAFALETPLSVEVLLARDGDY